MTFYGPMVAADFAREDGVDAASWQHALGATAEWSLGAADGLRVLRAGWRKGVLRVGVLSIFAEALGRRMRRCRRLDAAASFVS